MDVDYDDMRVKRPHRTAPLDRNSSCPSLSLQLRNSRGGEGKHLKPGSIKQDIRGGAISGRSVLEGYSTCLPRNRQSAPIIYGCQGASHRSSRHHARNEEWDTSPLDLIQDASRMFDSLFDRGPKPSGMNDARRVLAKAKRKVSFAPTSPERIPSRDSSLDEGWPTSLWYDHAALDQFAHDADARVSVVRRSMNYASKNERTYNAAIGLTSPEALGQYLSSPEEIIGIEHLLARDDARTSLRLHQRKVLLEKQRRQRKEGWDPQLLAEKLGDISSIAAHMALERATYLCLID